MRNRPFFVSLCLLMCLYGAPILAQNTLPAQLFPVRTQGKWGCIDRAGKLIIPAEYEYIGTFKNNTAIAQKNGLLGVINTKGNVLLPFEHLNLDTLTANNFATRNTAGKWGIVKMNGQMIAPTIFDKITIKRYRLTNTAAYEVRKGDKIGIYTEQGVLIGKIEYDNCAFFSENFIQIQKGNKYGLIDTTGKSILPTDYEAFTPFQLGTRFFLYKKSNKIGLMNYDGSASLPCEYTVIKTFEQNKATNNTRATLFLEVQKDNKKGLYDMDLNEIVPVQYHFVTKTIVPHLFIINLQGKQGLYNSRQKREVIPCLYNEINVLNQEVALLHQAQKNNILIGAYNFAQQKTIIPIQYTYLQTLQGGGETYFLTTYLKNYNFYNNKGECILQEANFDDIQFDEAGTFLIKKNNLWGIVGNKGKLLPTFETISTFKQNIALVKQNNLLGIINIRGEIILGAQYNEIRMKGSTARVTNAYNTEFITFDKEGNVINRLAYQKVKTLRVRKNKAEEEKKDEEWAFDLNKKRTSLVTINNNQAQATLVNAILRSNGIPQRNTDTFTAGKLTWIYNTNKQLWLALKGQDTLIKPLYNYINDIPNLQLTQTVHLDENPNERNGKLLPFWGLLDSNTGKYIYRPATLGLERTQELIRDFEKGEIGRTPTYYVNKNGRIINSLKYKVKNKEITAYIFYCHPFDTTTNLSKFNVGGNIIVPAIGIRDSNIKNGTWGLINRKGEIVAPPIYQYITEQNNLHFVKTEKGIGVLDSVGKQIIPCLYSNISYLPSTNNNKEYLMLQKNSKQYGYLDSTRTIIIDAQYKNALHFNENFAPVMIDSLVEQKIGNKKQKVRKNLWTFIDRQGQTIHPFAFTEVRHFSEGLAAVKIDNYWGYMNRQGQITIAPIYTQAKDFHEGKAVVYDYKQGGTFYINPQGKPINPLRFEQASNFEKGIAIAQDKKTNKVGLLNEKGEWIEKPTYFSINPFNQQRYATYKKEAGEEIGLLDKTGKPITKPQYNKIHLFINGFARVQKGSAWNFIDTTGKILLKEYCKILYDFDGNLALAKNEDGFWGYLNKKGEWQIKPQYDHATPFEHYVADVKKRNEKSYFIDTVGNSVPKPIDWYTWGVMNEYPNDSLLRYARIQLNERWGYWDKKENEIFIYPAYQKASAFYNGYAKIKDLRGNTRYIDEQKRTLHTLPNNVMWYDAEEDDFKILRKNNLYGFATKNDFILSEPKFSIIGELRQNRLPIATHALYGIADRTGKILIQPIYERVATIENNIFRVEQNDKIGYWDKKTGWIWQPSK